MKFLKIPSLLALVLVGNLAQPVRAQTNAPTTPATDAAVPAPMPPAVRPLPVERNWRFGIGLGYGMRTNPLVQSDDIPILVDLDIAWFGKRFFFDNFDLGFALADNRWFTANAVARVNSDRVFFGKTNTKYVNFRLTSFGPVPIADPATGAIVDTPQPLTVPDRDYAIEMGIEFLMDGEWGQATLRGFHDVSDTHDGFELSADYSYRWTVGRLSVSPSLGLSYKSDKLSDYYWGITPKESGSTLTAYQAEGGLDWEVGLRSNYYLTKTTRLALSANYERLHDSVAMSPIVAEDHVIGYFAGVAWEF